MKLDIQTQNEKQNFIGLLLFGNFIFAALQFSLLLIQFFFSPKAFALTWAFLLLLTLVIAYTNLRLFRTQYKLKQIWKWLKQHP